MPSRRATLVSLASLPFAAGASDKPIKFLVGFPPGGGSDVIARILAESLQARLGQPVVVENKAGAGGQIAAQLLKAAPADGTTFFLSHDHTISILPLTLKNPGFDPRQDFAFVAGIATFANAIALSPQTPATGLKDYLALVSRQGGQANIGIPAPASVPEFLVKSLAERFKLQLAAAPYRGSAPLIGDMLGGHIPAGVASVPDFITQHRDGKLRVVAVMGKARQAVLPEVPTLAELGVPGFEDLPYYGMFAPAGTPAAALERVSQALQATLAERSVYARLTALGLSVAYSSGADLKARETAYAATWSRLIRAGGFQPQ
jgi:tripartite-type tricarboxylate transporter receptor subunit TctC